MSRNIRQRADGFREAILDLVADRKHELDSLTIKELCAIASSIIPKESKVDLNSDKPIDISINHNFVKEAPPAPNEGVGSKSQTTSSTSTNDSNV